MVEQSWPLVLLGLRIGVAVALYLFLLTAVRALRAEVRARTTPYVMSVASRTIAPFEVAALPDAAYPVARRTEARDRLEIVANEAADSHDGALAGRSFALRGPMLIGRAASNSITLPERHVSARHARLVPRNGAWWVEDLGSTNGTYVGGERVTGRVRLDSSKEVRFGSVTARLVPAGA